MLEKYSGVLIPQRADPCILLADDGWYYFTASVPAFDLIELRRARTIEELPDAPVRVIWRKRESGPMSVFLWAPEIHQVDGKWCIYFAVANEKPDPYGNPSHRTYCLQCEGDPMVDEWVEMGQINTGWETFTIDATVFTANGQRYMCWAQRDDDIPGNSNLYIAKMLSATELALPATLLSVPVMVTDPARSIYGPGHNSFTRDEAGRDLMVFHARPYPGFIGNPLSDPNRHCHVWPVEYDEDDQPVFN